MIQIERLWAMPSKNTFDIPPIHKFVMKYLSQSKLSIDPFARDKEWATYTNDLDPRTKARYHVDALDFLMMLHAKGTRPDLCLFDPPYSPRQIKECYNGIGLEMGWKDAHRTHAWSKEKNIIRDMIAEKGIVLCFDWNSMGMGKKKGFEIIEILLICHGAGHNDTICMAEKRIAELF